MINGMKHDWCGRINWDNKQECMCIRHMSNAALKSYRETNPELFVFSPVEFNNPVIEDLADRMKKLLSLLNIHDITIGFDSEQDNEEGDTVGALIIDGWLTVYPEREKRDTLDGIKMVPAFVLDASYSVSNYPVEPDDVDVVRIGKWTDPYTALVEAIKMLFTQKINNILDYLYAQDATDLDIPF